MEGRQRRSFTEEYKRQAAELVLSSGRSITAVGKELGGTVLGGSPAEFGKILSDALEKWAKVIKFAGIKVE